MVPKSGGKWAFNGKSKGSDVVVVWVFGDFTAAAKAERCRAASAA